MKLVLINSLYPPLSVGGAERVVQTLARSLAARGDQVTVVCLSDNDCETQDCDEGVKIIRLPLNNIYWPFGPKTSVPARLVWHAIDSWNLASARALRRVLLKEKPDLVHTHNLAGFSTQAWKVTRSIGVPIVHTLHDYYLLCPRATMYHSGGNCAPPCRSCSAFSRPRRAIANLVDSIVGVSSFILQRHLDEGVFSDLARRHVVHNGLTHADLRSGASCVPLLRTNLQVLRLGYIGRIEENKGIELLLDATALLVPGSWQLIIAGKGETAYVKRLQAHYQSSSVVFLGTSELDLFFRQIDLLVVPSIWNEPLGMVAFEAFFFGVPVIAARRGGLPEIVTSDTGLLFDPESPQMLASVLMSLQSDPAKLAKLAHGASRAAARFEPRIMCNNYQAIYQHELSLKRETGVPRV